VLKFAVWSSAPLRDAAVLILPAVAAWETVAGARVGVDVAPAPPVTIATAAATATSVKILVHPNMSPPLFYAMPQPQPRSIEGAAPVLRSSPRFSRANYPPSRGGTSRNSLRRTLQKRFPLA
jgi:hypothetical protein